jgi:hypothetical protein
VSAPEPKPALVQAQLVGVVCQVCRSPAARGFVLARRTGAGSRLSGVANLCSIKCVITYSSSLALRLGVTGLQTFIDSWGKR